MKLIKILLLIAGCTFVYYWAFYLNKFIFDKFEFSFGVNWVFIPSGLQLLMVLIAGEEAAVGIILASCFIGLENYYLDSLFRTAITGIISGGSPLLARKICLDFLSVEKDLMNVTPKSILIMSIVFSIISATLHQIWYFHNGVSDNFLNSLFVMAIGNLLGTALVLYFITFLQRLLKSRRTL